MIDQNALRKFVAEVVEETVSDGRVAYTEREAAALMGVKWYTLRDCRRRGEIEGCRVGSAVVYTKKDLLRFLEHRKGR
jgi:hypothetical protein